MKNWKELDLYNPTDEHRILREMVRDFVKNEVEPQAHHQDRVEQMNLPLLKRLGALGLLGLTVQEEFGGSQQDAVAVCAVHEELAYSDPGFALAYLAHALLCANNLARNASKEQQLKYLPKLCTGEWIGSMGMSEPNCGTDVMAMETTAKKVGSKYEINGRKMWITNGALDESGTPADLAWIYARTGTDAKGRAQISTFLVDRSCKGYSVGQKIKDKLGMRSSNTAELIFDHCEVDSSALVGKEGESLLHMMKNLELERLGLAAMGIGIARRCVDIMNRYAIDRQSFGKSINQFGQIQKHIGDSFAEYRSAKAYVYETARRMDLDHEGNRLDSDGVKLIASTMAKNVADRAIQVLGGYGYVGEYSVERLWRDAKLLEIGGGTVEAHQKNIVRDLAKNPNLMENL